MATTAVITTSALGALVEDPMTRNEPANTGCNSVSRRTASQLRCAACGYNKFLQNTFQKEIKHRFVMGPCVFVLLASLGSYLHLFRLGRSGERGAHRPACATSRLIGLDAVVSAVISGFLKRLCAGDSDEGLNCPLNTRNDAKEIKAPEEKMSRPIFV